MDGFGFGWLLKMLNMCGWIQLVHQIPKDIEGNEVQISSTTSMLGRQLEDIEAVPVTFDDPTHTHRHTAGILLKLITLFFQENVYWKTLIFYIDTLVLVLK